jgi:glutathione S-transferase
MAIVLYHYPNSVCSEKVRIALAEKGVDWDSREVDLFKGEQFSADYRKLNPKGVVPTLVHDGRVLNESSLICEYLDDVFPEPALKPADPYERAQMRMYAKAVDEGLHVGVAVFSFAGAFAERLRRMPDGAREAHFANMVDLERRARQRAVVEMGVEAPDAVRAMAAYEKSFAKIDKVLADGRGWLMGADYTLAEINMTPYLARLDYLGLLDVWIAERPAIRAWYGRITARPSFAAADLDWITAGDRDELGGGGAKIAAAVAEIRRDYLENDPTAAVV